MKRKNISNQNSKSKAAKIIGTFTYNITKNSTRNKTTYSVTKNVTYDILNEKMTSIIESNNIIIAKKMIAKRIPTKDVIEITGLPKEKILNLLKTA